MTTLVTPQEQRALLRRLEALGAPPSDVLLVEALIDQGGDNALLLAVREMTAAMTSSTYAEEATRAEITAWRPLIERLAADAEARTAAIQAEVDTAREQLAAEQKRQEIDAARERTWLEKVVGPSVAGVLLLLTNLATYFLGHG